MIVFFMEYVKPTILKYLVFTPDFLWLLLFFDLLYKCSSFKLSFWSIGFHFLIFVTRLIRRVTPVEQWLLTFQEHMSSSQVFNVVLCYSIFNFMCMFCRSLFVILYLFLLAIVLSVLFRYIDSDYPFGIFKLLLWPLLFFDRLLMGFSVKLPRSLVLFYVPNTHFVLSLWMVYYSLSFSYRQCSH